MSQKFFDRSTIEHKVEVFMTILESISKKKCRDKFKNITTNLNTISRENISGVSRQPQDNVEDTMRSNNVSTIATLVVTNNYVGLH